MADYNARVAPFINKTFYVTAMAGRYPSGGYHSGLDISTEANDPLYSICDAIVIEKSFQDGGYGNYIVFKDKNSDFAFLYGHMKEPALVNVGDEILTGQQVGIEGTTGNSTGIHTHIEMQNYVNNGNRWIHDARNPNAWGTVYLPATDYMGFPNEAGISVYYDGMPIPFMPSKKKKRFKWVLYSDKLRKKY